MPSSALVRNEIPEIEVPTGSELVNQEGCSLTQFIVLRFEGDTNDCPNVVAPTHHVPSLGIALNEQFKTLDDLEWESRTVLLELLDHPVFRCRRLTDSKRSQELID